MPRPQTVTIELAQTLIAVIQHGTGSDGAAKALGINQPSLSKRIQVLNKYGWIERSGKSYFLTEYGESILPLAKEFVTIGNTLKGQSAPVARRPILRLGVVAESDFPASRLLPLSAVANVTVELTNAQMGARGLQVARYDIVLGIERQPEMEHRYLNRPVTLRVIAAGSSTLTTVARMVAGAKPKKPLTLVGPPVGSLADERLSRMRMAANFARPAMLAVETVRKKAADAALAIAEAPKGLRSDIIAELKVPIAYRLESQSKPGFMDVLEQVLKL